MDREMGGWMDCRVKGRILPNQYTLLSVKSNNSEAKGSIRNRRQTTTLNRSQVSQWTQLIRIRTWDPHGLGPVENMKHEQCCLLVSEWVLVLRNMQLSWKITINVSKIIRKWLIMWLLLFSVCLYYIYMCVYVFMAVA